MPVESAADRAVFVNDDEFAESITWAVGGGDPVTLAVIAQTGTLMIETQDGPDIQNREATVVVVEADLSVGAAQGDTVTLRGAARTVKSIEPDGTGFALVRLEEVL